MRGEYAAIHSAIVDDADFKPMSAAAKCCWYTLRMVLGASGIDLLRSSAHQLADLTGLEGPALFEALNELIAGRWLIVQGDVLWLRNALLHNPNVNLRNENHNKSVARHIAGLPRLEIVNAFAVKYGLLIPFDGIPSEWDTQWYPNGIPDPVTGSRSPVTVAGGTTTTAPASPTRSVENSGREDERPRDQPAEAPRGEQAAERPTYTMAVLAETARTKLGLGMLSRADDEANKRILRDWYYSGDAKRSPDDIMAAIEGAADMRNRDLIGWDSAKPGTPMTLKALMKAATLDHTGDGAVRYLWDVAIEHQRRREEASPARPPASKVESAPMKRLSVEVPKSA